MTFLVRWSRMRMLDDISTTNRLLGFGRLNSGLGLVWGCRMTSAPSTEYWDWGEEPPRLNLGQLLPLQTFRLVAKSNLWKLLKSSAFQQYCSRPEKKLAQLSFLSYKSSQTQSFSKVAQKCIYLFGDCDFYYKHSCIWKRWILLQTKWTKGLQNLPPVSNTRSKLWRT